MQRYSPLDILQLKHNTYSDFLLPFSLLSYERNYRFTECFSEVLDFLFSGKLLTKTMSRTVYDKMIKLKSKHRSSTAVLLFDLYRESLVMKRQDQTGKQTKRFHQCLFSCGCQHLGYTVSIGGKISQWGIRSDTEGSDGGVNWCVIPVFTWRRQSQASSCPRVQTWRREPQIRGW